MNIPKDLYACKLEKIIFDFDNNKTKENSQKIILVTKKCL